MQVLAMADGTTAPAALGGTLEMALPDWRWRRRTWPPHPDCGCAGPAAMSRATRRGPGQRSPAAAATLDA